MKALKAIQDEDLRVYNEKKMARIVSMENKILYLINMEE
jgi:hypothetical protein